MEASISNHVMTYHPSMEKIDSDILRQVMAITAGYHYDNFTEADVWKAITTSNRSVNDFAALLSPAALSMLEAIAQAARAEKSRYFGNSIHMFTPVYLSNYCDNYCVYCGFNCKNKIQRSHLNADEIEKELQAVSKSGLQEVLLLTGESRRCASVEYIGAACRIAKKYFALIGLEVYPLDTAEYQYLHACGADYVTVFQETYNPETYGRLHLAGHKRVFPYRFHTQERALRGGMRGVGFGALLGLDDFRKDAFAAGVHACLIQQKYPHAELSLSCPRLRPTVNHSEIDSGDVRETQLLQVICAYRLFLPYANIIISTRECERVRNHLADIAATKISAGVSTGIGTHACGIENQGDEQFEISDSRSVNEIYTYLLQNNLQPVMKDYLYV